jgi:peptide chain release factor subunit 1
MLTEQHLRELLDFQADGPVLSVYLNTDPSEGNADAYKLRLRTLLKPVELPKDVDAVERYIEGEYKGLGRSVAIFSCSASGYFKAFPLAVPVVSLVTTGDHPGVKPLADLFERYGGIGVVLADRQGARLFHFHLGELREQEGVMGQVIKHTKDGGASSLIGRRGGSGDRRSVDEAIERNMKESVEFAVHFFGENHIRRIMVAGTDENVALFRSMLPKAWQSLVMGSFPMGMTASHTEVLSRAMQVARDAEWKREAALVEHLSAATGSETGGVNGLEQTLKAINSGRVKTLVLTEGYVHAGFRCQECQMLTIEPEKTCVDCGKGYEKLADVIDTAVGVVLRQGGEVEFVAVDLALPDSIGAFLRY